MAIKEIFVPDVGGGEVDVIELLVSVGDHVDIDDGLITVESDKASMDIPAPFAGVIKEILVKEGDKLAEGKLVAKINVEMAASIQEHDNTEETSLSAPVISTKEETQHTTEKINVIASEAKQSNNFKDSIYAGPAVRRIAREFGIDLTQINGSGDKNRITKGDVQSFVRQRVNQNGGGNTFNMPQIPIVDFAKFGEIDVQPLSKINKFTGANLHRNWISIPHVTQFDEADITEMEAFRQQQKKLGVKLTPIVFVMKAVVAALKAFPRFNASLDATGENLVLKKYFHIGVAVDTPNGLVVPVIRDVDQKGLLALAQELGAISQKAREKGLTPMEMQGSCFAISSLGGIGGTAFTPIINAPDVAILGLSKSVMKPLWQEGEFVPRLMLPLSLSYDHRVIDGADGARFVSFLSAALGNSWQMIL